MYAAGFAAELEEVCGQPCSTSGMIDFIEAELANPIGDTIEAIDALKELNIPTALLTNNWYVEEGKNRIPSLFVNSG